MTRYFNHIIFVIVLFVGVVFCEDVDVNEEIIGENGNREVREFDQEGWKAVESYHESDLGWIPREDIQDPDQLKPKRRRLRKRKRRPPVIENPEEEIQYVRRRVRPYRLEPWEEISEEDMKPNIRRRIPQPYPPSEEIIEETTKEIITSEDIQNSQEKPLGASIFVEEKSTQNSISDLKNLLKQSGGKLSLSEVLQQKNLSLSELLQGGEKAISALTEKTPQTTAMSQSTTEVPTKYKRLPPSIGLKKDLPKQDEEKFDILSEKETMQAQRKRLSILQAKENKIYANIIKYDVVTEPTTERRIFIPVRSKSSSIKLNNIELETTTEHKLTSTITYNTTNVTTISDDKNKEIPSTTPKLLRMRSKLPTTNAKLRTTTKKLSIVTKENPLEFIKPVKININEVAGFAERNYKPEAENITEGPMRIQIDLDNIFTNKPLIIEAELNEKDSLPSTSDYQNETYVTAKQEIMEVMKDPVSRDKLSRILENRNMTLEELVEQRERGSSQRHLADIFHNNTREPEPRDEPHVGHISPDFFNGFKTTNRQQKSTKVDEVSEPSSTPESSTSDVKITTSKSKEAFPTIEVKFENQALDTFPWKQLYPDLFPESKEDDSAESNDIPNDFIQKFDIESSYASSSIDEGFFINVPSGVKSALFVSLAIIALSIIVFLAILVIFKWMQKKNRSLNYCSSLTTKFKPPVMLQGRPTTAIKTFMSETLGRKKNYYKSSLQSMSDEIWDGKKDRKESF